MPLTQVDQGLLSSTAQYTGFKNRIINGAMVIAQRGTSAVTITNPIGFPVDRWVGAGQATDGVFTLQQSSSAPAGFNNSIVATVTTADSSIGSTQYYLLGQRIEGYNVADFGFGTANAQPFTVSFWVRSSLTGSFGISFENIDETRRYGALYTINSANTWEYKTVTVPGDTTGTWNTTTGIGLNLWFCLGTGSSYQATPNGLWANGVGLGVVGQTQVISTNGATLSIAGVQLEKGSTATSFDYRPYGTELQLCQRYFQKLTYVAGSVITIGLTTSSVSAWGQIPFMQEMRTAATVTFPTAGQTTSTISFLNGTSYPSATGTHSVYAVGTNQVSISATGYTGLAGGGQACWLYSNGVGSVNFLASAEL